VHAIPDHLFWSVRQSLKAQMLHLVRHRISVQHLRNRGSQAHLDRLLKYTDPANPNVLTIGFARRFATYKRAMLIFSDPDWLREILAPCKALSWPGTRDVTSHQHSLRDIRAIRGGQYGDPHPRRTRDQRHIRRSPSPQTTCRSP
jgi:hypothetical protein